MLRHLLGGVAALCVLGTSPAAIASSQCWKSSELTAGKVRELQSLLMVAALQCTDRYNRVAMQYNEFVRKHRSTIVGHNDALKVHFIRAYGITNGQRAYDEFTTTLANRHANEAAMIGQNYCEAASTLVRLAIDSDAIELAEIAGTIRSHPADAREACPVEAPVVTAVAVPLEEEIATEPAPAPALAVKTAVIVAAAPPAILVPEPVAEPQAAPAPRAAVASSNGTAEALAAAAIALKAAADALSAANAAGPAAAEEAPSDMIGGAQPVEVMAVERASRPTR